MKENDLQVCTFEKSFKTRSYSLTWDGDLTGKGKLW